MYGQQNVKMTVQLRNTAMRMWIHIEHVYQPIHGCLYHNISNNNSRLWFADVFTLHVRLTEQQLHFVTTISVRSC